MKRTALYTASFFCLYQLTTPSFANDHTFDYGLRLRYVDLEQSNISGKASSALVRINLASQWHERISTFIELDHAETGFEDEHSDGFRFNNRPILPDTEGTDLNQLFVRYKSADWQLTLGRQRVNLDQQRHVGGHAFWQNEQTFDALRLDFDWLSSSNFSYIYVDNVNRIFGDDADEQLSISDSIFEANNGIRPARFLGDHEHNTHLFHLEINEIDYSTIHAYAYLIDNKDAPPTSSNTVGASYTFKYKPSLIQYRLEAEIAAQQRTEIPNEPTLPYFKSEIGLGVYSTEFSVRYEVLGAKDGVAFFTPLASLHEFHGWSDRLNVPPPSGIEDLSAKVTWRQAPWKLDVRYHDFKGEDGSGNLASEVDVDISLRLFKNQSLIVSYVDFKADENNRFGLTDTRRIFFTYSYNI